ncbi:MAG: DUF4271 domain-containing protein [Flavobacterium sp.]|nr:DUF4271 domain-containing protein [Flavobacterium sp.]
MNEIAFQPREVISSDWALFLFVIAFVIVAINKNVFAARFFEFIRLGISDKYNKIYRDSSNLLSTFTISMFVVQLISFSFFILLLLHEFQIKSKTDGIAYVQIVTFLSFFILSKFLIEKIIATTFQIEEFITQFNLLKVNYRTYLGFIMLPLNIVIYYNVLNYKWLLLVVVAIVLLFNVFTYLLTIKAYQNLVNRKLFYFILYLCTLEIAPYYFMYYLITKN